MLGDPAAPPLQSLTPPLACLGPVPAAVTFNVPFPAGSLVPLYIPGQQPQPKWRPACHARYRTAEDGSRRKLTGVQQALNELRAEAGAELTLGVLKDAQGTARALLLRTGKSGWAAPLPLPCLLGSCWAPAVLPCSAMVSPPPTDPN